MEKLTEAFQTALGQDIIPGLIAAIAILVLGWLGAIIITAIVKHGLKLLKLNERMGASTKSAVDVESTIATGVFYVTLLVVLLAILNVLKLEVASAPIQAFLTQIFEFLPNFLAGLILAVTAWILATVVKTLVTKGLTATNVDERLSAATGVKPVSESLGDVSYWFTVLCFLPAILGVLQLGGLLLPVQGMLDKVLQTLPNIFGAVVIGAVGWVVAKILGDIVHNLLSALGIDKIGESAGLTGKMTLSKFAGAVVYLFVFIPALIAALDTLQLQVVSQPASEMLAAILAAIPNVLAAALILGIAFFMARLIARLITNVLEGIGFDRVPKNIGVSEIIPDGNKPSQFIGKLIVFFTMLFAVVAAANRMGFTQVSDLVATFIEFGGSVLLGSVIIAIGLWLANMLSNVVQASGHLSTYVAAFVKVIILGLSIAMGLQAMGLAGDIVKIAFALVVGSVAVAIALAFGLGGRDAAGKQVEKWFTELRK